MAGGRSSARRSDCARAGTQLRGYSAKNLESNRLGRCVMGSLALIPLRALSWGYYWLPSGAKRLVGGMLGHLLRVLGVRSGVIRQNLEIAFPGTNRLEERERLFREAYRHLGSLVFEILLL